MTTMTDKFDSISDELLAAYLDGNTTSEESRQVEDSLNANEDLMEIADITHDVISFEDNIELWKGDYGYWGLGIDPVFTIEELLGKELDMRNTQAIENFSLTEIGNNEMGNSNMKTYGEERNYNLEPFDENINQGYKNTCAIRAQEIILRDYGIMIPQEELMKYAAEQGWYDPGTDLSNPYILDGGTPLSAIGNLLNVCGIETKMFVDCTVHDLTAELRQGHRVIVSVDADELWESGWFAKQKHKFDDLFHKGGNHALIVAGVEVNPKDLGDVNVILTDPGTGDLRVVYKWKEFHNAFEDGNCTMISTTQPAPYQYNAETSQMEPSGFTTDFYPSQIHLPTTYSNIFPSLSNEYYELYGHYEPLYSNDNYPWDEELAVASINISGQNADDEREKRLDMVENMEASDFDIEPAEGQSRIYDEENDFPSIEEKDDLSYDNTGDFDENESSDIPYDDSADDY